MQLPAKAAIRGCVAYATQPAGKTDLAPFLMKPGLSTNVYACQLSRTSSKAKAFGRHAYAQRLLSWPPLCCHYAIAC